MSDKTQLLLLAFIFFLIGVAAGRNQIHSTTSKAAPTLFNEETVEWVDRHGVKRSLTIKRRVHEE